jgi:3-phenylpropionate/cinnamic acid dioxygenase small subunit
VITFDDWLAIVSCQVRYTTVCDRREWDGLADVFTADASGNYGGWRLRSREGFEQMLRQHLDGAGATQHLVGNHVVQIDGDEARAQCSVHAFHVGVAGSSRAGETYTVIGVYHDTLVRTADGWRIAHRILNVDAEVGDREILTARP